MLIHLTTPTHETDYSMHPKSTPNHSNCLPEAIPKNCANKYDQMVPKGNHMGPHNFTNPALFERPV